MGVGMGVGGAWGKQEACEDLALKPLLKRPSPPICPAQPPSLGFGEVSLKITWSDDEYSALLNI